jgi:diguanylate cyclase (GGDEF)-like protein/PAS domain S-box-containing protein
VSVGFGGAKERGPAERLAVWLSGGGELSTAPSDAAVADAAMRLIETIDASPDALITLDSHGVVTWATSATFMVLGWHPDELVGRPIAVVALEENVVQQQQFLDEVERTGHAVAFSTQRRRSDGEIVEVSVSMAPVLDSTTGEFVGACAAVRSVTPETRLQTQLAQQDSLSAALARRSSDVALIAKRDTEIVFISPSIVDVLGFTPEQLVGSKAIGLVHEDDQSGVQAFVERVVSCPGAVERKTFRVTDVHGEWRWVEETLTNCVDVAGVEGLVANVRDVTNEVEARAALTASERRYRTIVETAQEGVLVIDHSARVLVANRKAADILGHSQNKLHRRKLTDFIGESTASEMEQRLASRSQQGDERYEATYLHPDGSSRIFEIAASPISLSADGGTGTLAMISDVTEARRVESELQRRALHDALTGLPNRALLNDRLTMALARQDQEGEHLGVAVLSIDLDGFKLINDVHGHEIGDAILVEVAERLRDASRPGDTVARVGGDEFVVVAEDVDIDAAVELAGRLRTSLLAPIAAIDMPVFMDASVGVAVGRQESPSALLRFADDARSQAKAQGRGRVHVYDAACDTDTGRKLQVANALREALDSDQLTLGYQPIVDLTDGHVVAVEALLRWVHPDLGSVPPPEIVATARAIGLAERLDLCVLQRACADLAGLRDRGIGPDLALAVNLSAQSVEGGGLPQVVRDVSRSTGWPLGQLTLELTEGVLMTDTEAAAAVLAQLREMDVSIAIDDFGTGYSSLAYLQRLPVATLKVDRSFVEHVPADAESCAIARSIIDLARALTLTTVAEGIETRAQADYMLQLGCGRGQGYLWSPAVSPAKLEELLLTWPGQR